MKKVQYIVFALAFTLPIVSSAASFTVVPSSGNFTEGQAFSSIVYLNPASGESITSAQFAVAFPAEYLEVTLFTPASGLLAMPVEIDNAAGTLKFAAGILGGASNMTQLGTIAFKAKKEGNAAITFTSDSKLLDSTNADKYVESTGASFTIAAPAPVVAPVTAPTGVSGTVAPSATGAEEGAAGDEATTTEEVATSTAPSQAAAAAAAAAGDATGSKNLWYYLIAALAIIAGVFAWRKWGSNASQ